MKKDTRCKIPKVPILRDPDKLNYISLSAHFNGKKLLKKVYSHILNKKSS